MHVITAESRGTSGSCKHIIVEGKDEEKGLISTNSSSKKDSREFEEREEAKRGLRILTLVNQEPKLLTCSIFKYYTSTK